MGPRGLIRDSVAAALATAAVAFLWTATPAAAQDQQPPAYIEVSPDYEGEVGPWDISAARRVANSRFRLFGEGDRAWTSLRMVGDNVIWETNTGPGDDFAGPMWSVLFSPITQFSTATGTNFQTFGIPMFVGAPRSEWVRYLVEGVESLRNVQGDPPGFTVLWNGSVFGRVPDMNSADGLIGTLLSGVVSTTNASCLDHSATLGAASLAAGFQLLPASNCTPTWSPPGVWKGDRPIAPDTWIELFEEGGADFRFNRWRVPSDRKDPVGFLGNNVSTYGHFNDYNASTLAKFGNVIPGQTGSTTREGWPLGLDFYFDAYTFTLPTVANAKFWSALIVNNSEALYGVPHDYDSLYIGFGPWPGRAQDGDNYSIPELGAWVSSESSMENGPECAKTDDIPLLGNTCGGFQGRVNSFDAGAHGMIVLKSPIGDLRNKLFSDPASPFFMPNHPLAGDTLTFNHSVSWNFGNWGDVWNQGTDRQRFGVLSSTRDNTLDGTACSDFFGLSTRWRTFMSPEWPNGDQCQYKSFVPGDWTYISGRPDGQALEPDTLHLALCGPNGCPDAWADTTWQGWSANAFGNLSQWSIGPFRLEAGDTTELTLAMYSGRDSVPFVTTTRDIVDFYLGLFAGPEAPPPVTIRSLDIGAGIEAGQDAEVTLVWDDAAENFVDPFLTKFADDMEAAPGGTELAIIRDANPGIVSRIRDRAVNNLDRLLVFRSCDGGSTFDGDGDCEGDPATDASGGTVEPGWQAFAVLEPDATGNAPNTFSDGNVTPGVTYLYVILSESQGFSEVVINDPNAQLVETAAGDTVFTCGADPCSTTELTVAPSLLNPLSRSSADPNVVSVYVPASVAAGARPATVTFREREIAAFNRTVVSRDLNATATVPFDVLLTSKDIRENRFVVRFGNRIQVLEERNATTGELNNVIVTVEDLARTVVGDTGTTTQTRTLDLRRFSRDDGVPVTMTGETMVDENIVGNTTFRTFEIGPTSLDPDERFATGFVLAEVGGGGELPLLVSGDLSGQSATPGAFLAHPAFPGFLVSADQGSAGNFDSSQDGQFWTNAAGDTLSAQLDPTLAFDVANSTNTEVQGLTFGEYLITFSDSVFGPRSPFRLNFVDPSATDEEFDASLAAREAATTGVTDDEAVQLVADAIGADPSEVTLVPARFPFTIRNLTHGRQADLAMVDAGERPKQLGVGSDTLTVTVDPNEWIPRDPIYVIEELDAFETRDVGGEEAIVVDPSGDPIRTMKRVLTFAPLDVTCGGSNASCNPVRGEGGATNAGGEWIGVNPEDNLHLKFFSPFTPQSKYSFTPKQSISPDEVLAKERGIGGGLDNVRVVPNPYLFFSEYEASTADRRIMFTNLPPNGEIRIYTVAGNFVQEIDWRPSDLVGNGDLFWNLRTREGNELAAGLYIFVVTATNPASGAEMKKMGKFVVIR